MIQALQLLFLLGCLFAAFSCGGGGGSDENGSLGGFSIEMIDQSALQKTASLDPTIPLRIYSDQNRENPNEATHVRIQFIRIVNDSPVVVAQKTQPLQRESVAPYEVTEASRKILMDPVPWAQDYTILITLGKNFGSLSERNKELFFYQGALNNVTLDGASVLVDGKVARTLYVPMASYIGVNDTTYTVTGYTNFQDVPREEMGLLPFEGFSESSVTSFQVLGDLDGTSYETFNVILDDADNFQSHYFQITDIPSSVDGFNVVSDAGAPTGMVLNAFVSRAELVSGNAIVIDLETTMINSIVNWYIYKVFVEVPASYEKMIEHHPRIEKVVKRINGLLKEMETPGEEVIRVTAGDMLLMAVFYKTYETIILGDPLSQLTLGVKMDTDFWHQSPTFAGLATKFMIIRRLEESKRVVEVEIPDKPNIFIKADDIPDELALELYAPFYSADYGLTAIDQIAP